MTGFCLAILRHWFDSSRTIGGHAVQNSGFNSDSMTFVYSNPMTLANPRAPSSQAGTFLLTFRTQTRPLERLWMRSASQIPEPPPKHFFQPPSHRLDGAPPRTPLPLCRRLPILSLERSRSAQPRSDILAVLRPLISFRPVGSSGAGTCAICPSAFPTNHSLLPRVGF